MKIIGAGLSKTGTKSLNAALTTLGCNVYDYSEHTEILREDWQQFLDGNISKEAFKEMYKDADAAIAFPVSSFWEEFLEVFPDAKVILTVRKSEDIFVASLIDHTTKVLEIGGTITAILSPTIRSWNRFRNAAAMHTYAMSNVSLGISIDRLLVGQAYRRHNAYVKQRCPKDRLLIFNCEDGWKPLCKFLCCLVPDEPFPHKNIKGAFAKDLKKSPAVARVEKEVFISVSGLVLAAVAASYFCLKSLLRY